MHLGYAGFVYNRLSRLRRLRGRIYQAVVKPCAPADQKGVSACQLLSKLPVVQVIQVLGQAFFREVLLTGVGFGCKTAYL